MSEPTKVLYIFLSVADLITGIGFSHSALASIINKFPFGCSFSVFWAYVLFSNTCTSLFLILLITIDCFVAVIFPFRYPTLITKSRTIKVCCITMVMVHAIALMMFGIGSKGPFSDIRCFRPTGTCYFNFETRGLNICLMIAFVSIAFFAFMLTALQFKIASVAKQQARRIAQLTEPVRLVRPSGSLAAQLNQPKVSESLPRRNGKEWKGVYVCIAVSLYYLISLLPSVVWNMYVIIAQDDPYNVLRPFFPLFWLTASQCWMNTIIYMVSKKSYRDTAWTILRPRSKRVGVVLVL